MKALKLLFAATAAVTMTFAAEAAKTAKAVVADGGATLKFVYDETSYGTKGTDWFSVADAEAKAPGYNPPWHDSCYATVTKVVFDSSFAVYRPKHCGCWFADFASLVTIWGLSNLDTSSATSLMNMFRMCSSLASLDVSGFDTSNVTSMNSMFYCCSSLTTLDVSGFNTSNVTSMCYMFGDCSSLTTVDVSGFDTSKVTNMQGMFDGCSSLTTLDVTGFDTAKVTDIRQMFNKCSSLETLDLSGFDTAKVTDMRWMVRSCSSLKAIYASDAFVTTAVTSSNGMFLDCTALVGGAGTAYDSSRTDETYARIDGEGGPGYFTLGYSAKAVMDGATLRFVYDDKKPFGTKDRDWFSVAEAEALDPSLSVPWAYEKFARVEFDPSFAQYKPKQCCNWFADAKELTQISGLRNLDVSNVANFSWMFANCCGLTTLDLSGFDMKNATHCYHMFAGCGNLRTIYALDRFVLGVGAGDEMFKGCTSLVGGKGTEYDATAIDATYARIDGGTSAPGYFTAVPVYRIQFKGGSGAQGTMADQICARDKVCNLAKCAFTEPSGKPFKGWAGSNGRRYDDGVLVFNAAAEGATLTLTAIWE